MKRRVLWLLPLVGVLLAFGAYATWSVLQVRDDLRAAQASAESLTSALQEEDRAAVDAATTDLREATGDAVDRTDGPLWSAMTVLPLVGDDVEGVRALARSLDTVSTEGVPPLVEASELLRRLQRDGSVSIGVLRELAGPVSRASGAVSRAHAEVGGLDSSGYAGPVKGRFEDYVQLVADAEEALSSAETASEVLPGMLGGEGPRDYLLVFQNNAEIRATGGLPGSWALMHAEDGKLGLTQQGTAGEFPEQQRPILPMSEDEKIVYTDYMGRFFQNSGFTPDFPRAAELMNAHWERRFPATPLDGIIALDPVAMSYLLEGTGPITAAGKRLTQDNLVEELLSKPYLELEPAAQDALFAETARSIFDAVTGDLQSPLGLVEGLSRAADENRLLVASFVPEEAEALEGSEVLGALPTEDGETPFVDIGISDGTMSKMSYYLRYDAEIRAMSCNAGRQQLQGSIRLRQSLSPNEAADLPVSVTGPGEIKRGQQVIHVTLLGPHGGRIKDIRIDGKNIDAVGGRLDGRPALTLYVYLGAAGDATVNWSMETGEGQSGDGAVGMTPGIVRGDNDGAFSSAC